MGLTLYDKKSNEEYSNRFCNSKKLISLLDEFNIKPYTTYDFFYYQSIYDETIGDDSIELSYSVWCEFLEKYVWSFFDKQKISFEEFNNDVEGTIDTKNMEILIEHLKLINVKGEINNEIKDFLIKHKNGITYH